MKKILPLASIIIILCVSAFFLFLQRAHAPVILDVSETISSEVVPTASQMIDLSQDMIEVTAPLPNTSLTSPLTITGRARGFWYFEASFPIELRDANNVLIAKAIAQAQGDWMTEDFVPFIATLTFPAQPAGSQGVLTFKNDNPS